MRSLRAELALTRGELRAEMADLRAEMADLRTEMMALEHRMTLRLGAAIAASTGAMMAAFALIS